MVAAFGTGGYFTYGEITLKNLFSVEAKLPSLQAVHEALAR